MTLLALNRLAVRLGGKPILNEVSLTISAGEFVGLIGPNGAGKSTLLRAILGLVPASGEIAIAGKQNAQLSVADRALQVAYLPQEREVAWPVTAETVVWLGRTPHRPAFAAPAAADVLAVEQAMARMDILGMRHKPVTELSGGERARVLIARALAQEASLLLADEPAAGLDPSHQIALMRAFADLASEGRAVVTSMHDLGLAARWCSRLVLIHRGSLVADGPPASVVTAERLRAVYGIEALVGEAEGAMIVQPLDVSPARS